MSEDKIKRVQKNWHTERSDYENKILELLMYRMWHISNRKFI